MREMPEKPPLRWWRGWVLLIVLPGAVLAVFPAHWPRWALMWTLALAIYVGVKWLTWRRTPVANAPGWRHVGYLLAWPGLDPRRFLTQAPANGRPSAGEWLFAAAKFILGMSLCWGVAPRLPPHTPLVVGWTGMVGMIFVLHFGLFHLLSNGWRAVGVDAHPLMHWPIASRSISEFWGVRWNTAFRDLTHRFLFQPLQARLGVAWAVLFGFLFSGLVHDLVISLPAGGGGGGPTLFFLLQGIAILTSRSDTGRRLGLRRGPLAYLLAMLVLIVPVGLLFHPPFVEHVILPFMQATGMTR